MIRITVAMEAYNEEHNALAEHHESVEALLAQEFPLDQVELLIIGSPEQLKDLQIPAHWNRFGEVRLAELPAEAAHYWQQKNFSARTAHGEIIAWLDSDVLPGPHWLAAIASSFDGGADVSVGPSLYRTPDLPPDSPFMLVAALVSWGFVLSSRSAPGRPEANSLLAHNVAVRRETALQVPYREGIRSFQSSLYYFDLVRHGAKFVYQPMQRAAHGMNLRWWVTRRHFRTGWETYEARKCDELWPRIAALESVPWVEPVVLRGGLVLRDIRHWFRFRHVMGIGRFRALALLPLLIVASAAARTAEMVGMFAFKLAPEHTAHQARF